MARFFVYLVKSVIIYDIIFIYWGGEAVKFDRNSDVTKNVKIIEWMKKELILSVGDVFDLIFKGVKPLDEALQDTLANIIMITYLLAKRLGISFSEIDYKIKEKIRIGIDQNHSVESWYGDFSNLKKHMENREWF